MTKKCSWTICSDKPLSSLKWKNLIEFTLVLKLLLTVNHVLCCALHITVYKKVKYMTFTIHR